LVERETGNWLDRIEGQIREVRKEASAEHTQLVSRISRLEACEEESRWKTRALMGASMAALASGVFALLKSGG
jgi:hypothetical protein